MIFIGIKFHVIHFNGWIFNVQSADCSGETDFVQLLDI